MKIDQPAQIENVLEKIRLYIERGKFRFSKHAIERQKQRSILPQDALHVLIHGKHEKEKTTFDAKFHTWKYAIRGKTEDDTDARVVVAIVDALIIITVIRITKKKRRMS